MNMNVDVMVATCLDAGSTPADSIFAIPSRCIQRKNVDMTGFFVLLNIHVLLKIAQN